MVAIPKKQGTIHLIDAKRYGGSPKRGYLGMSGIGESCWRKLWYGFHFVSLGQYGARTQRIFDMGHEFEKIAIADLKSVGCFMFRVDGDGNQIELTGEPGEEQEELVGFAGHSKGHPDGRIIGLVEMPDEECLLELKTMNDDKFSSFKKLGIEKSHNNYYCQVQRYMNKMGLKVCFFLAINKNTCEYWWEFVDLDRGFADELERKEKIIIISDEPPERAYQSNHYLCSWCNFYDQCHAKSEPNKNCRTCEHCDIENGGVFTCNNAKKAFPDLENNDSIEIDITQQVKGCDHWEKGWGL